MAEIFLIEDDALKATAIQETIREIWPEANTTPFRSYRSGLAAILANRPKLMILDMTLPSFDRDPHTRAGRVRPLGGYDLLRKLKLHGSTVPFVIVSMLEKFGEGADEVSFADITDRCSREFPCDFYGSVFYETGGQRWRTELRDVLHRAKDGQ